MAKRASYREAVDWIAGNDDTEWMTDENGSLSVTASLVADLWAKTPEEIRHDLTLALRREKRRRAQ